MQHAFVGNYHTHFPTGHENNQSLLCNIDTLLCFTMRDEPLTTCKRKKRKLRSKEAIRAAAHAKRGNESSDDEFYQEEVADAASQWLKRKHQKVDPHLTRIALRLSLETEGSFQMTNAEYEDRIAFCCKVCHCPESIKVQYKDQEYVQASGELTQWHRRCCHSDEIHDETWASPFLSCLQEVNQLLYSDPCPKCNKPDNLCVVCQAEILQKKGVERVDPKVTLQKYWQNIKEGNEIIGEDFHEGRCFDQTVADSSSFVDVLSLYSCSHKRSTSYKSGVFRSREMVPSNAN